MTPRTATTLALLGSALALGAATQCAPERASAFDLWPDAASEPTFTEALADAWDAAQADDRALISCQEGIAAALDDARADAVFPRTMATLDVAAEHNADQDYGEALSDALRVLELPDAPATERRAHDVAGYAALHLDEGSQALEHLLAAEAMAGDEDPLAVDRDLWIAEAALLAQQPELARTRARQVIEAVPRRIIVHEARFLEARAMLALEDHRSDGIARLDGLLGRYPEYPFRDRETIALARAEIAEGRVASATARLDAYLWDRPYWPYADDAQALLADLEAAHDVERPHHSWQERYDRARQLRLNRHWTTADPLFVELLDEVADDDDAFANEIRLQLVLNAYDSARFDDALRWLDALDEAGPRGVHERDRVKWRARTLSRLGREDEAWDVYHGYWSAEGGARAHRNLFEFAFDLGRWQDAYEHMEHFTSERGWRSWDGAFLAYLTGRYDTAASRFEYLSERNSGSSWARYTYWWARTEHARGNTELARTLWTEVADTRQFRYYGLLSEARLVDLQADGTYVARPGRVHWWGPEAEDRTDYATVVSDGVPVTPYHESVPVTWTPAAFADAYGHLFPEARGAAALYAVGAREEARVLFRDAAIEFRALDRLFAGGRRPSERRPIRLDHTLWAHAIDNRAHETGWWGIALGEDRYPYPSGGRAREAYVERHQAIAAEQETLHEAVIDVLRTFRDHYLVRRMAYSDANLSTRTLASTEELSGWYEAYARSYAEVVMHWSREYNLNPYLVWAIVIVESDMNPDSISHADAYGLLQVIPKTGDLIALRAGEADFGIHELIDPRESVRYGTYYLAELVEKFHGQEMLAAIAYNAGPHQVQRWLEWRGDVMDMDAFVETIPYDGARRYPQRTLRHMAIYRYLYLDTQELYVGSLLDPTFEDNIYF